MPTSCPPAQRRSRRASAATMSPLRCRGRERAGTQCAGKRRRVHRRRVPAARGLGRERVARHGSVHDRALGRRARRHDERGTVPRRCPGAAARTRARDCSSPRTRSTCATRCCRSAASTSRRGAAWGWDSTASARLAAAGFPVAQDATAFVFRHFAFAPNRAWIREEFDFAAAIPSGVRRMPGLRSTALHHRLLRVGAHVRVRHTARRIWASPSIRRNPGYAVAGSIPWLRTVGEFVDFWPPAEWRTSMRHVRGAGVRSAVWGAGLVVGSLRARKVVL